MISKIVNQEAREVALKIAIEDETRRKTDPNESHEKSIIVLGSKQVGKTTMIYRFLEKEDVPKATVAMDYSYGRKAGKSLVKDLVHVWEVGHLDVSLISNAMTGSALSHSPHHTTVLIMLDLSKPDALWNSLEDCLDALRSATEASYSAEQLLELRAAKVEGLREKASGWAEDVPPMRLCIVGGRYDEFRSMDGDDRQFVGQALRAAAHVLGASLHYHSAKDSQMLRRTKELLSHYSFKGHYTKGSVTDYEKPLSIAAGSDSLEAIELGSAVGSAPTLDAIKQIYVRRFPQGPRPREPRDSGDVALDPAYREPIIDRLTLQREQEISVLLRDMLEAAATNIPIPEPY